MSGRSIGMSFGFLAGARVGGELTFVPAHINAAGKKVSHRCEIPVYTNSNRGNGGEGKSSLMRLVVWGDLARKCALTLSMGKAIDALVELSSYQGKVYQNRQVVIGADGQPLTTNKTSMTIMRIVFGEETQKHIDGEIASSARPANWNNPAHPDWQLWKNELQRRIALQYTGGEKFGYARVIQPQGQILPPEQASNAAPQAQTGGFAQQAPTQTFAQPQSPAAMVGAAFGTPAYQQPQAPVATPVAPQMTANFGNPQVPTQAPQQGYVQTGSFGV